MNDLIKNFTKLVKYTEFQVVVLLILCEHMIFIEIV